MFAKGFIIILHELLLVVSWEIIDTYKFDIYQQFLGKGSRQCQRSTWSLRLKLLQCHCVVMCMSQWHIKWSEEWYLLQMYLQEPCRTAETSTCTILGTFPMAHMFHKSGQISKQTSLCLVYNGLEKQFMFIFCEPEGSFNIN